MSGDIAASGASDVTLNLPALAKWAYECADAMLAERGKDGEAYPHDTGREGE